MSPADDDKDPGEGEGFLSAWSRRKLAARREKADSDDPEAIAQSAEDAPDTSGTETGQHEEDEVDADFIASLPSIDDLTDRTDLAPFMRRGVPIGLRNAALRKVWMLNPLIRDHVDPALDYAWDWNAPGGVPGGGGTLTSDGVAQMVKNLLGDDKRDDGAEDPAGTAPADMAETGEAPRDHAEAAPAEPVRRSTEADRDQPPEESADAGPPENENADTDAAAKNRVNLPLATARRHGGALPE